MQDAAQRDVERERVGRRSKKSESHRASVGGTLPFHADDAIHKTDRRRQNTPDGLDETSEVVGLGVASMECGLVVAGHSALKVLHGSRELRERMALHLRQADDQVGLGHGSGKGELESVHGAGAHALLLERDERHAFLRADCANTGTLQHGADVGGAGRAVTDGHVGAGGLEVVKVQTL